MNIESLVRENIKSLRPFSSARAEFKGEAEVFLDANESPYQTDYNRYPDPHQRELKGMIATAQGVKQEQIILGNGSDEIIDLIVRTFCEPKQDIVRYISPSFGMYKVVADINDIKCEEISLDTDFDLGVDLCLADQTAHHKVLFLCSPNNPTGNLLSSDRVKAVIDGWQGIVVIDEAYIEFADQDSMTTQLSQLENVIVLQTFSKAMGGAGLRLGMGFASSQIISYLVKVKPPYNVNNHTQAMAMSILKDVDLTQSRIAEARTERQKVVSTLSNQTNVKKIYPSEANFLLIRFEKHKELYQYLMSHGVIIRDRSSQLNCAGCLRVTIGLPEENDRLIKLINQYYEEGTVHR